MAGKIYYNAVLRLQLVTIGGSFKDKPMYHETENINAHQGSDILLNHKREMALAAYIHSNPFS